VLREKYSLLCPLLLAGLIVPNSAPKAARTTDKPMLYIVMSHIDFSISPSSLSHAEQRKLAPASTVVFRYFAPKRFLDMNG
jgi:hypothetical protein